MGLLPPKRGVPGFTGTPANLNELVSGEETDLHSHAGGGGASPVHTAHVQLANAEILALPTTPKELVAAPGANKVLVFSHAALYFEFESFYGNVSADSGARLYIGLRPASPTAVSQYLYARAMLYFPSASHVSVIGLRDDDVDGNAQIVGLEGASAINASLALLASNAGNGDYTDGDPANVLHITVLYSILNLTTGEFE